MLEYLIRIQCSFKCSGIKLYRGGGGLVVITSSVLVCLNI